MESGYDVHDYVQQHRLHSVEVRRSLLCIVLARIRMHLSRIVVLVDYHCLVEWDIPDLAVKAHESDGYGCDCVHVYACDRGCACAQHPIRRRRRNADCRLIAHVSLIVYLQPVCSRRGSGSEHGYAHDDCGRCALMLVKHSSSPL